MIDGELKSFDYDFNCVRLEYTFNLANSCKCIQRIRGNLRSVNYNRRAHIMVIPFLFYLLLAYFYYLCII